MATDFKLGQRIVVVGTTGSGKTTLAGRLAARLDCPHIELDAMYWEPGWVAAPTDVFRERAQRATGAARWVVDGNYRKVRDIVWTAADTLVWLDFPFALILWRLLRRTLRRIIRREVLWNGNRETFVAQFLRRESLFVWAAQSHWRHRREYLDLLCQPEYAHLRVVRLRSLRQAARWLDG